MAIRETSEVEASAPKRKVLPKEKYVLKHDVGTHTIHDGPGEMRVLKGGDVAELTEGQAHAFRDKFDSYAAVLARSEVARRTVAYEDAAKKAANKESKEEQARLRAEAEQALAEERAKLDAEDDRSDEDNTDEDGDEDVTGDTEEGAESADSLPSPTKAAILGPKAPVKTIAAKPAGLGLTKKKA